MFKHILIPTDGSELSDTAAKSAVALAQALRAEVTAMHAMPTRMGHVYGEIVWVDENLDMKLREQASSYLDRIEEMAKRAEIKCSRVLKSNDVPWRAIVEAAKEEDCDLIAMAAHGRRGVQALVLGSETNRVLIHAPVPVLVYSERD